MKILFFDMEFADGRVPGSIYSIGYLITNERFEILTPPTDLLIHPDSTWNEYVLEHILAYPLAEVERAPKFPSVYPTVKALYEQADMAVGFAVGNDTRALWKNCERYHLSPILFRCLDTEKLCKRIGKQNCAHGLAGYVKTWCGIEPENLHRSDCDAYATMMLLRAVCREMHATPQMIFKAYPECISRLRGEERAGAPRGSRRYFYRKSRRDKAAENRTEHSETE
ncbi:MAG: hypothetical protein E7666_04275 [Ruminococcaceae bacterium]|nr:hypothetical protein [Oscillospiraceae bacterium]